MRLTKIKLSINILILKILFTFQTFIDRCVHKDPRSCDTNVNIFVYVFESEQDRIKGQEEFDNKLAFAKLISVPLIFEQKNVMVVYFKDPGENTTYEEQIERAIEGPNNSVVKSNTKKEVTQIDIYKSEGHGIVGTERMKTITDPKDIAVVMDAITSGKQIPGELDTATPDYDVVVHFKKNPNHVKLHFWLDPTAEKGMFALVKNTGTGYLIPKDATRVLLDCS